jgi:phosphoenolpyruvate carboxykinase (ATP)
LPKLTREPSAKDEGVRKARKGGPDFTFLNAGDFVVGKLADVPNKTSVNVNFTTKEQVILGTSYAGEMKKGIFGVIHYYMP